MLEHEDFAESYQNILQNEIQKTYFDYNNFSILTTCCYVRKPKASNLDIHSTAIVTEASNLSYITIYSLILVVNQIRKIHQHVRPTCL